MDITDEADAALEAGPPQEHHPNRFFEIFGRVNDSGREEESIDRARFGTDLNAEVFALYEEYAPRLFRYLRSLHLRPDEAEELIQETFTLLIAALLKKTAIANVQGWIVQVAHHQAVDAIKRRERDANRFGHISDYEFDCVQDNATSPEQTLLEREQGRQIEVALERFTPLQRQCFYLRAEGFRYGDIALALGITKQRVAAVLKKVTFRLAAICG